MIVLTTLYNIILQYRAVCCDVTPYSLVDRYLYINDKTEVLKPYWKWVWKGVKVMKIWRRQTPNTEYYESKTARGYAIFEPLKVKVKVKWPRYRPGVAQRVGRGIAVLFRDRGTGRWWVVSSTPQPHFTPGNFSQALYKVPWWWLLCDPKHVRSTFKYFIILILSTYYILCISWII